MGRISMDASPALKYFPDVYPDHIVADLPRRWDRGQRCFVLPANMRILNTLKTRNPRAYVDSKVLVWAEAQIARLQLLHNLSHQERSGWIPSHLPPYWDLLYPYQRLAIEHLVQAKRALCALEPGLGKTAVAANAAYIVDAKKVLVVTLLSLLQWWKYEIKRWTMSDSIRICHGNAPGPEVWTVANYDSIVHNTTAFAGPWDVVIIDESVSIKNRHTHRFRALKQITSGIEYIWLLSGSPTTKYADDLWTQFHLLDPKFFSSYWRFAQQWCMIDDSPWGQRIIGTKNPNILGEYEDLCFYKRQDDVLDLPPFIEQIIPTELGPTQEVLYRQMQKEFLVELGRENVVISPNLLAQMLRLMQLASNPAMLGGPDTSAKRDALLELLEHVTHPVVVWTLFRHTGEDLYVRLMGAGYRVRYMCGDTPEEERASAVSKFQEGQLDVLIANQMVGKYGLTLTKARTAIWLERNFGYDHWVQAKFRVRRIGTSHSPVLMILEAASIDRVVRFNLERKIQAVRQLTTFQMADMFQSSE